MIYDSMKRCSNVTGIPYALLKRAKDDGLNAFRHGKIYYDCPILQKWLIDNKDTLSAPKSNEEDNIAKVKLANLKKDGALKDSNIALNNLLIRSKEESLLTIEDVSNLLISIGTMQIAMLNKISKDISVKCSGKSAGDIEFELNKEFKAFVDILKQDLRKLADE